jgi:hypothetical protein
METRDYSKFKFLKTNRGINNGTVVKITKSIKEWGIIPGRPVLVDGDYNIIDGQHRFMAIKGLGHPIPYEVINGDVIAKTMALNANQSQWRLVDYMRSYSEQGIECYRRFLKFEEKYKFGISASIVLCFGFKAISADIRKGKVFDFIDRSEDIAIFIESFQDVSYNKTKPFIIAIALLFIKSNESQRELVKTNILKVPQFSNYSDYMVAFENIINYRKRGTNKITL